MFARILLTAALTGGLGCQSPQLVYDSGWFQTSPGFSNVDLASGHSVPGYGGQLTASQDNALFDDFTIAGPVVVDAVEFYCYQTGSGTTSTITSGYVAFYPGDPSSGAQPLVTGPSPTADLFTTPNNPVRNAWTGVYREINGNGATDRPIMAVRLRLEDAAGNPTPVTLASGTWWIRMQAAGSGSSGPWFPPITCDGQGRTGDAMQRVGGLGYINPVTSGNAGPQGLPFKLFGSGGVGGQIRRVVPGCGNLGIEICGAPSLGGFLRVELTPGSPGVGIPVLGLDLVANPQQYCGCFALHTFPIAIWFANATVIHVPADPALAGLGIATQGAEIFATTGCAAPPVAFSDGYLIRINS